MLKVRRKNIIVVLLPKSLTFRKVANLLCQGCVVSSHLSDGATTPHRHMLIHMLLN